MTHAEPVQDVVAVLTNVPYFAELDSDTVEAIARTAVRRAYDTDQIVFLEGEPCAGLYVVQEGWLKAIKLSPEGREQILTFLGPGEDFNALSVFVGRPNPATVITLEPTTLWLVPRETMLELLAERPELARLVIQKLAGRVLHLLALVEDLSLRSVEARVANFLLDTADGDVVHRHRWTTQAALAGRLGTVTDVLNRALRGLAEEGLIHVERDRIVILDRAGLAARRLE